jgi:hypothetical protein
MVARTQSFKQSLTAVVVVLLVIGAARPLRAHTVGVSRGDYVFRGSTTTATLQFARPEVMTVWPEIDADGDGSFSDLEMRTARAILDRAIARRIIVASPDGPCTGTLQRAALSEEDGLSLTAAYQCPGNRPAVKVTLAFLDLMTHGHRHLAAVSGDVTESRIVAYTGHADLYLAPANAADVPVAGRGQVSIMWLAIPALVWLRRRRKPLGECSPFRAAAKAGNGSG